MSANTGWQRDGSYVPCPECKWVPPVERNPPPGRRLGGQSGTYHYGACPTVRILTPEQERDLRERLREMDRTRRRGAAEANNYWIG